jgi:hypothetical protein
MPIIAAAIITAGAGLVTGATQAIVGGVQGKRLREAGDEARALSEQQRQDSLDQFKVKTGLEQHALRLREDELESSDAYRRGQLRNAREQLDFAKNESRFGRATKQYDIILNVLNQDQNLKNSLIAKLQRRPKGVGYAI